MKNVKDSSHTFHKKTLPSGLRILTCEMPHTRSVSISIFVSVGSRYENDAMAGVSHFLEHILFKGTKRRPDPVEISRTIESTGGVINAGTEQELTVYWCKVAQPHFTESLDLLIDMLRNSLFDQDSIDKERMVILEELAMINDYPTARMDSLIDEMLWPNHPLGRDIGGTKESVMDLTRQTMVDHLRAYYSPTNVVISIAGNVLSSEVEQKVEQFCENWPEGTGNGWEPVVHSQASAETRLEYRKTEQTHVTIALPGLSLQHKRRYALDLLSIALGEGMSSRLFVELREKRGLAYDVHSSLSHFKDTGAFLVTAGVDPKRIYDAVGTIMEQIQLVQNGIPDDELERAKQLVGGRLMLRMEDTRAVSGWMGSQETLLGKVLTVDQVVKQVNSVTPQEIKKVAGEILTTEHLNMAVVGPCKGQKRLEKLLRL